MADPERILLIRPSALGDVCRTVPVLVSLRRRFPGAAIDWLVNDSYADAVAAHPALTRVVPFPRRRFAALWKPGVALAFARWRRGLREAGYGLVIDAQGLFRSGFLAGSTRAARRVGHADAREFGWVFLNERHAVARGLHSVDRMLALLTAAGIPAVRDMRLYTGEADRSAAAAELRRAGASGRIAVLAPTSKWEGKRWPAERFAALAGGLLGEDLVDSVVVVGAPHERGQCSPLLALAEREQRVADFIGRTSVGELMGIIERSALVVANDSAALHMAVGFGRPLVGLYGPTRVGLVGPYGRAEAVLQRLLPGETLDHKSHGSGRRMMERISVEDALRACRNALRENRRAFAHTS